VIAGCRRLVAAIFLTLNMLATMVGLFDTRTRWLWGLIDSDNDECSDEYC
jgi:hypothetical protein